MSIFSSLLVFLFVDLSMAQLQQGGGPDEKEKTTALKDLDELMKKDEPPLEFPDTLEGFEYAFNENGQLRHIKTGEPFIFNYREDLHRWNQKRYEALGEDGNQGKHRVTKRGPALSYPMFTLVTSEDIAGSVSHTPIQRCQQESSDEIKFWTLFSDQQSPSRGLIVGRCHT
ncbi:unnamed protein product [Ranitomeya imitator]|uniref:Arb2 domain-containing protein n=1 Tax=Ranitomeya imitator TaxID=111125 RepID=A0ABN9KYB7_9NEOB|nr:unnamed protein product [Ranitomeya imitator]